MPTLPHSPRLFKLLYVEDDPMLRELYSHKLDTSGYLVSTAPDGEQGLQIAKSLLPDLILLDMLMPKLDGLGMLKLLRQHPTTQHIPVVLLSNTPSLPSARECQTLGIVDTFLKANVTPGQLVSYLQTYFANHPPVTVSPTTSTSNHNSTAPHPPNLSSSPSISQNLPPRKL